MLGGNEKPTSPNYKLFTIWRCAAALEFDLVRGPIAVDGGLSFRHHLIAGNKLLEGFVGFLYHLRESIRVVAIGAFAWVVADQHLLFEPPVRCLSGDIKKLSAGVPRRTRLWPVYLPILWIIKRKTDKMLEQISL